MKIILLAHVKNLGQKGEIKEVSDGFYQNFLAPRRLAAPAVASQVGHIHAQQAKAVERLENMKESASAVKARLEGKELTLTEKASEAGKLYASVHTKEIAKALRDQLQLEVPEKNIEVDAIKTTGDYPVTVKLFKDTTASFTLHVRAA